MKVEAVKRKDGLFIPMIEMFRKIDRDKILLDIEIIEPEQADEYEVLDQLVGLCTTERADASVNHDAIIYGRGETDDIH